MTFSPSKALLAFVALTSLPACKARVEPNRMPGLEEHFINLEPEVEQPVGALYIGRFVGVSDIEPAKPRSPACLAGETHDATGDLERLSYRLLHFEVHGVLPDGHGAPVLDQFFDVADVMVEDSAPLVDLSDYTLIGIRLSRESAWDEESPLLAADLPQSVLTMVNDDNDNSCEADIARDFFSFGDFASRTSRVPWTLAWTWFFPLLYELDDEQICALTNSSSEIGEFEPLRINTVGDYECRAPIPHDAPWPMDCTQPSPQSRPIVDRWCWPRERFNCLVDWFGRNDSGDTSCSE
jgi:hypothetical protein